MTASYNPLALSQPQHSATIEPLRLLIYGKPKTRKTWWAGTAAATHRVWLLDGENNTGILRNLPPEHQSRINRIPLAGQPHVPALAMFCAAMFKVKSFLWHMGEQRIFDLAYLTEAHDDQWFLSVDIRRLTTDDVIIIDSWTKVCSDMGLNYAIDNALDIFGGERGKRTAGGKNDAMDYFRFLDMALDAVLQALQAMPCHMVLIGHEQSYELEAKTPLGTKKVNKTQVISGSGKHSSKVPAYVSDVLFITANDDGRSSTLHTASEAYRDGGGANVAPSTHQFPGWDFAALLKETNKPPANSTDMLPVDKSPFYPLTGKQIRDLIAAQKAAAQAAKPTASAAPTPATTGIIKQR